MTMFRRDAERAPATVATRLPLLSVIDVRKYFDVKRGANRAAERLRAVDGVSFQVEEGETLGLVGESGCGKSTLARILVGLHTPSEGSVALRGVDVHRGSRRSRGALQMVFQDPTSSLNPRHRIPVSVAEPLRAREERSDLHVRAIDMLARVGLAPELARRYPNQLSGGQQQRVCIARALIADPELVVFDEAISSLDVSLQAQVIALITELQEDFGTTYVFITHDLARAMEVSDRIAIMYLGKIVELVPARRFEHPLHPYSKALIAATLTADPEAERRRRRVLLKGDVPNAVRPPSGCRFHPRCPHAQDVCQVVEPPLVDYGEGHSAACHFAEALAESPEVTA